MPHLKPVWRLGLRAAALVIGLCLAILVGFSIYAVTTLPDLKPWHTEILDEEFSAERDADLDFEGYLKLEDRLFAEMRARAAQWDRADEAFVYSRFNPASGVSRLVDGWGGESPCRTLNEVENLEACAFVKKPADDEDDDTTATTTTGGGGGGGTGGSGGSGG